MMPELSLSGFDLVVLAVVLVSTLFSLLRGLSHEAMTIAAWLGAVAVAYYGFDAARGLAQQTIETAWLADVAALFLVFILPLIVFKVIGAVLAEQLPDGWLGRIDHWLGALFGVARGVLIVCIVYLGLGIVFGPEGRPAWLDRGVLVPYVSGGAQWLAGLLPESAGVQPDDLARKDGAR